MESFLVSEGLYKGLVNEGELHTVKKGTKHVFLDEKVMNEALLYKKKW